MSTRHLTISTPFGKKQVTSHQHVFGVSVIYLYILTKGYDQNECQTFLNEFLNRMKASCASEVESENQILEHAKHQVVQKLHEYTDYCRQLGRVPVVAATGSGDGLGNNYADKLQELDRLINSLNTEVSQRSKLINAEFNAIDILVSNLGDIPPSLEMFQGPDGTPELSDLRLHLLKQYKVSLETKREKTIEEMKEIAIDCHNSLIALALTENDHTNTDDNNNNEHSYKFVECDAAIISFAKSSNLAMGYHTKDLELLKERRFFLDREKEVRRSELGATGSEIARLWTLLRIPSAEREQFQTSFKMNLSLDTLSKGRDELKRLQEIRSTSLSRVIGSIRNDIVELWGEAGIDSFETRTAEFPTFFEAIESLDDSSVETHEEYFKSLKARVEELRPLLQKVSRREAVVMERIELEHIQLNPERLKARGPNAREERKREEGMTTRVKNLEKNTKELLLQIKEWERNNGPFIYGGEKYPDRVTQQEAAYTEIRDNMRNERKKKDGKLDLNLSLSSSSVGASIKISSSTVMRKTSMLNQSLNQSSIISAASLNKTAPVLTEQALKNQDNQENVIIDRNSTGSNGTECTTATEVRPRSISMNNRI